MRLAVLVAAVAAVALAVVPATASNQTVTARNFEFSPSTVMVNKGETVTWNVGDGFHTVRFENEASLGNVGANAPSKTFPTPGTYKYYCENHATSPDSGMMLGRVVVTDPSATPTATATGTPGPTATPGTTPAPGETPAPGAPPPPGMKPLPTFTAAMGKRFCAGKAKRCKRTGIRIVVGANAALTIDGNVYRSPVAGGRERHFGLLRFDVGAGKRAFRFTRVRSGRTFSAGRYRLVLTSGGVRREHRFTVRTK